MFVLDLQSRTPIYEQMKQKITELVMLGVLQTGEQLPSVRSLARELGVNPNTVQKAYQELEREGVVYSVTGRGSFVADVEGGGGAVRRHAQEQLLEALRGARMAGLTRGDAVQCVDEIYRGDGTND